MSSEYAKYLVSRISILILELQTNQKTQNKLLRPALRVNLQDFPGKNSYAYNPE